MDPSKNSSNPSTPSSSSTLIQMTPEMFQQFLAVQQNMQKSTSNTPLVKFGSYELKPFPSNAPNAFKAKATVTQKEQVLLDYAWNARNKTQLTVALQALSSYFQEQAVNNRPLVREKEREKFEPMAPASKLLATVKELEIENTYLQNQVRVKQQEEGELEKLKEYILSEEHTKLEGWGRWRQFPQCLNPVKSEVLDIVLSNHMSTQIFFQQLLRRLASNKQLFRGFTIQAETYEDDESSCKGFTYYTCSVNMEYWRDTKIEGEELSITKLLQYGVIKKLFITKKNQLRAIALEKVCLAVGELFEQLPEEKFELTFQTIPPSFYPTHLDDARSYITVRVIHFVNQNYTIIPQETSIPEEKVDSLDQINMFRAMVYRKPYVLLPGYHLVAEDKNTKVFSQIQYPLKTLLHSFSNITTEFAAEVIYFKKIKAYHLTRLEGDLSSGICLEDKTHSDEEMEEVAPPSPGVQPFDDEGQHNLQQD